MLCCRCKVATSAIIRQVGNSFGLNTGLVVNRMAAAISTSSKPKLVLHFDVNKTLILTDVAGGKDFRCVLGGIVSDNAWGRVTDGRWSPIPELPLSAVRPAEAPESVRFFDYMMARLPKPVYAGLTGDALAEAKAIDARNRETRNEWTSNFLTPDGAGHIYADVGSELIARMSIPTDAAEDCAKHPQLFASGYRYIVPAYFALIESLLAARREFNVIFRTFGTDAAEVIHEHNLFCSGRHPLYPREAPLDGSHPDWPDLRVNTPAGTAAVIHDASGIPVLAHVAAAGNIGVARGDKQILATIQRLASTHRAMFISDDYNWWHAAGEVSSAGKLLAMDECDPTVHHVFFDDNIDFTNASIVRAVDVQTETELPFSLANDMYYVRAEPVAAVLDDQYYAKKLAMCEANRAKRFETARATMQL